MIDNDVDFGDNCESESGTSDVCPRLKSDDLRHAFLIMAHRDDETLHALLRMLDDPRNDIYIHMDAKNTAWTESECLSMIERGKCYIVPRVRVVWGGYSQIECEISLLGCAVSNGPYAYYHLLSGQDLPIKSQDEIHCFFDSCGKKEFLRFENHGRDYKRRMGGHVLWNAMGVSKRQTVLRKCNDIVSRLLQSVRRPSSHLEIKKGDNWFSITDKLARYIVDNSLDIKSLFWDSFCGDELFLQTVAWNSDKKFNYYRKPGERNDDALMRLIAWGEDESPRVFRLCDLDKIMSSGMLFARKFDCALDGEVVREIERLVG